MFQYGGHIKRINEAIAEYKDTYFLNGEEQGTGQVFANLGLSLTDMIIYTSVNIARENQNLENNEIMFLWMKMYEVFNERLNLIIENISMEPLEMMQKLQEQGHTDINEVLKLMQEDKLMQKELLKDKTIKISFNSMEELLESWGEKIKVRDKKIYTTEIANFLLVEQFREKDLSFVEELKKDKNNVLGYQEEENKKINEKQNLDEVNINNPKNEYKEKVVAANGINLNF